MNKGLITTSVEQITSDFPAIGEMAGVSVIVYWSKLCPRENACDFSLIERVLEYWGARGKKVILAVATVGYPVRVIEQGRPAWVSTTPDWVLAKVKTYRQNINAFGKAGEKNEVEADFPSYDDVKFVTLVDGLVKALAQFDGHPALAYVRISTGYLTEDHPSDGLQSKMPGFNARIWLAYCRSMVAIFARAFKRSQLEFDVGRTAWFLAIGTEDEKREAAAFHEELMRRRIFVAWNGLDEKSLERLEHPQKNGPSQALQLLRRLAARGVAIGLEAGTPAKVSMRNVCAVIAAVVRLRPKRLVLFASEAALENYRREGSNPRNRAEVSLIAAAKLDGFVRQTDALLRGFSTGECRYPAGVR